MSAISTSYLITRTIESLCSVAGRRTSNKFTYNVIAAIIKTLEPKYPFLQHVIINPSDSEDAVSVSSKTDTYGFDTVCSALGIIIRVAQMDLKDAAGLYFIKEFRESAGNEIITFLEQHHVDLSVMELEQQHIYGRQQQKSADQSTSLLGYAWDSVTTWKYDEKNDVCVLYNSSGAILDKLNMGTIIKNHVNRLTRIAAPPDKNGIHMQISEKERHLLSMILEQDLHVETVLGILDLSIDELKQMIQKLLKMELLQHIDMDELTLTERGIEFLEERNNT